MLAALVERFGEPMRREDGTFWIGESATISINERARVFSIGDSRRMKAVQLRLLQAALENPAAR